MVLRQNNSKPLKNQRKTNETKKCQKDVENPKKK
jgi:hypothetical protein